MMEAALEGLRCWYARWKVDDHHCIAVTQLTSTTDERQMREEQLIHVSLEESVITLCNN